MLAPNCPSEPRPRAQELAAHALTGIAAGGCKEKIRELGGIELLVRVLKSNRSEDDPRDTSPTGTTRGTYDDKDLPNQDKAVMEAFISTRASNRSPPRRQHTIVIGGGSVVKLGGSSQLERVKAHAANALAELARDDAPIQREVVQCGGIDALVAVVTTSKLDSSKARAAGALWSMSSTSHRRSLRRVRSSRTYCLMAS